MLALVQRGRERMMRVCRGDGMDVLDLRRALMGIPGTYLNPDGHWSARGVEIVARVLAGHLGGGGAAGR